MPVHAHHALVLSHIAFENLGSLDQPLRARGFEIESIDVATARFPLPQAESCDLLVVLGGPIGVYDQQDYPFLKDETACIGQRLATRKPILGICLGAQLMAAALGSRVYPGKNGAEIGWSPIRATQKTTTPAWFAPLLEPGVSVFHWHGDTFDLPSGARPLAQSARYANQAFAVENFALGLQFHPEVSAIALERWYVGHACELHHAGIPAASLRQAAREHAPALEATATRFWKLWLDSIL
jgi:GMP synthase (glutamine-hydrolysing)